MNRWAVVLLGISLLATKAVTAQESVTLDQFSASAMPEDDFQIDRPLAPGHLSVGAMVHLDYALDPLVYTSTDASGKETQGTVVGDQITGNAALSLGLGKRGLLFVGLPVVLWMDGQEDPAIGSANVRYDNPGLGDAYAGGRVVIWGDEDDVFALAGQVAVTFPTAGKNQQFRGSEFLTAVPEVLLAIRPGLGSRITANLGARIREKSEDQSSNLAFGSAFNYALGFAIPVWNGTQHSHFDLHVQAFGTTNFKNLEESPLEAVAGAKYFHHSGFVMGAAGGPGITRGFGTPVVRGIFMLGYQTPKNRDRDGDGILDDDDRCPSEPEDKDGFEDEDGCPDPDNDKDGILDADDQCPNAPETVNALDDEDGCPDIIGDDDHDGLLNNLDLCPDEPEDIDGFEDENGCPDPDNDRDGVLDKVDRCPMEKGPASHQGCPDPDRDGDGVVDRVDNCPDEPGPAANQGCAKKQKVLIQESNLQILDRVYFKTGKAEIQKRSFDLLDNVADVLIAHPEIQRVIIEGHTDSRGRRAFNVKLSKARAESVRKHLVRRGVDADRLDAEGYGPDRPLVEGAKTPADHASNRRVEFRIPQSTSDAASGSSDTQIAP